MERAWDAFQVRHCVALFHLPAKLSHVGADMDGLASLLYQQMDCG
jgi:hypothetical protein